MNQCDDEHIQLKEIAESLKCGKIRLMKYMDDFETLEKRQLIKCRRSVNDRRNRAKNELLADLNLKKKNAGGKNIVKAKSIIPKNLTYNEHETRQIKELTSLLHKDKFAAIQQRLSENGMRKGFACLFYGPPGTGKTETVYQIARETGRDIMAVDISETKSMWFGESEKRIKQLFDRYRGMVKTSDHAPILLFNEADAIIGKRMEFGENARAVEQTENAIQNIILQEMENLEGILIATTNLTKNMDRAFERRFLYKIEFSRPTPEVRTLIWQSILPSLSAGDAHTLASRYDFSGGQIENIARKRTVDSIISGADTSIDKLKLLCDEELLEKDSVTKIGFMAS
jgi:SpoVK/Ycf46/Vps4 family AAA+-type ATPase